MIDCLVKEMRDKGISVDNYNTIVEDKPRVMDYKHSKYFKRQYRKREDMRNDKTIKDTQRVGFK